MKNIQPVLLGADMNCYSVARAFHEAYGVTSKAFGRFAMGETKYSRIVDFTAVENFENDAVIVQTLQQYAKRNPAPTKILMGCTDDYIAVIIRNKEVLKKHYITPYIDEPLKEKLESKDDFYELCQKYDIPYPKTVVVYSADEKEKLDSLPFEFPVIIKPSSSIQYWKHPFEGMKKVYTAKNVDDAKEIVATIFNSGYAEPLIIQDTIPGADDQMRVLTAYCNRHAKVEMVCLGHVLLEEHTPKALGNHAAIITEYNLPLMEKLTEFLEDIGYVGFANFDIKYDTRDNQYKVFEINLRQGRSNYYVTGAGLNIAKYIVNDRILKKEAETVLYFNEERYWHSIPNDVVWQYTKDEKIAKKAMDMAAKKQDTTALDYAYDLRRNPLRRIYLWEHYRRYHKKYKTYCQKIR